MHVYICRQAMIIDHSANCKIFKKNDHAKKTHSNSISKLILIVIMFIIRTCHFLLIMLLINHVFMTFVNSKSSSGMKKMGPETKIASKSRDHKKISKNNLNLLVQHDSTGLSCYTCKDMENCEETWLKIEDNPSDPSLLETCSTPGQKCMLHFSTFVNQQFKLPDLMHIDSAGCEIPDPSKTLDPSGCFSTPVVTTSKDGASKWTGSHGTKTCYCNENMCNNNHLVCNVCSDEPIDCGHNADCVGDIPKCKSPKTIGERESANTLAQECIISGLAHDYGEVWTGEGFSADKDTVANSEDNLALPLPHCPKDMDQIKIQDWEDEGGNIIETKCSCSTSYCNGIVRELHDYFGKKKRPLCHVCKNGCKGGLSGDELRRRRGEVCFSKYVKDGGDFRLVDFGGIVPPRGENGEVIKNGCVVEEIGGKLTRHCYCDGIHHAACDGYRKSACNKMKCYACRDKYIGDCKLERDDLEECNMDGVAQECFISFDDTVSPPVVEAGCRDYSDSKDPICDEDVLVNRVGTGEKRTCRCETSKCNLMVEKLFPEGIPENPRRKKLKKNAACSLGGVSVWLSIIGIYFQYM